MIYRDLSAIDFGTQACLAVPRPERVLMTTPEHFDVEYVINAHMAGQIGNVDRKLARRQWDGVRRAFEETGLPVTVIDGAEGFPDMVFCANQTLPVHMPTRSAKNEAAAPSAGSAQGTGSAHGAGSAHRVVLSRMYALQRRLEVPYFQKFFAGAHYDVIEDVALADIAFEGMGDAMWHPGRWLLWGGYGFRTNPAAYDIIDRQLDVPIVLLYLDDPDFYHLDTCLCVLDEDHALAFPGAFEACGYDILKHFFKVVIEVPEREARELFACNATCADGRHVIIQKGSTETCRQLRAHGFTPVEVDTGEFMKSGGSVYCMKQLYW